MTEHLSRHELEQVIATETRTSPRAATRRELKAQAHVLSCDVCTTRRRSIETARARFLELAPADAFVRATLARAANAPAPTPLEKRRVGVRAWALGFAMLAAAAAAVLWTQMPARDAIRLEGTAALEVFVKRGSRVELVRDGDALASGDQLGFVYTLSEPRHLLLLGVDEQGGITRYFPAEGAVAALLRPGARVQLPLGVELDGQRGRERLIAFFGTAPLDELAVRRALGVELERARREGV